MKHILLATALLGLSACATNLENSASAKNIENKPVSNTTALIPEGWQETVLSVSDLEEMTAFYQNTFGWEVRSRGNVSRSQLTAWGLPANASAKYTLVANPGSKKGFVRIVDFDGVDQVRIREHDQAWETGGIFNMNIRVADMKSTSKKATDAGWQGPSAPVNFIFGPYDVWEWIPRHKDGVRVAFVERVAPVLTDWPNLKTSSRAFNSTQIVADIDRAMAFYEGVLGFQTYLENRSPSKAPADHVLGLSREAMVEIVRDVRIVHPAGKNDGSVEILEFEDYTGRDFSDRAVPPNLGNLMLRFPVPSVDKLVTHLESAGVNLTYQPVTTSMPPYGNVKVIAIRAPDGAWLEFFEKL